MGTVGIIGAQWGSEGKGVVAAALAPVFDAAVRVGGPNAGHSFRVRHESGEFETHVMRGVPCAWINPEAVLVIGAGAAVDPHLLIEELAELPPSVSVLVDPTAAVVLHADAEAEKGSGLWEAIGSTNEGVGQARIRKIRRRPDYELVTVRQWVDAGHPWPGNAHVTPTQRMLQSANKRGDRIMLEGTQGSGLSLHHGTEYPKATSEDTNISGMLAQVGLPPTASEHVFLVARTLPIRVAGNSGPMGEELDWADIAQHVPGLAPEKTTVTKRVRRISRWYNPVFDAAVGLNDPCGVFLMFADYLVPEMAGTTDADALLDAAKPSPLGDLRALTAIIEEAHRVPIVAYGTGGPGWSLAFRGRCAHGVDWTPDA